MHVLYYKICIKMDSSIQKFIILVFSLRYLPIFFWTEGNVLLQLLITIKFHGALKSVPAPCPPYPDFRLPKGVCIPSNSDNQVAFGLDLFQIRFILGIWYFWGSFESDRIGFDLFWVYLIIKSNKFWIKIFRNSVKIIFSLPIFGC